MFIFPHITRILDVTNYEITVLFDNQTKKTVDFSSYIRANSDNKYVAELLNKTYFMNVVIDEIGGLQWPNGFDCSARKLYYWEYMEMPEKATTTPNATTKRV